jgi:hypothetical protein
MNITNLPKAVLLGMALVSVTILLGINSIDESAGLPIISAIVFYGLGNGVAGRTGKESPKIFGPKTNGD